MYLKGKPPWLGNDTPKSLRLQQQARLQITTAQQKMLPIISAYSPTVGAVGEIDTTSMLKKNLSNKRRSQAEYLLTTSSCFNSIRRHRGKERPVTRRA